MLGYWYIKHKFTLFVMLSPQLKVIIIFFSQIPKLNFYWKRSSWKKQWPKIVVITSIWREIFKNMVRFFSLFLDVSTLHWKIAFCMKIYIALGVPGCNLIAKWALNFPRLPIKPSNFSGPLDTSINYSKNNFTKKETLHRISFGIVS